MTGTGSQRATGERYSRGRQLHKAPTLKLQTVKLTGMNDDFNSLFWFQGLKGLKGCFVFLPSPEFFNKRKVSKETLERLGASECRCE